jgi:hypothetical protein
MEIPKRSSTWRPLASGKSGILSGLGEDVFKIAAPVLDRDARLGGHVPQFLAR